MPSFHTHVVAEVLEERDGLARVRLDDGTRAYVLTHLTGPVALGDEVVVNTTAVELGLGTGGWHVVHWNRSRRDWSERGAGHIMKLRYTSLQADTGAAEEAAGEDEDLTDLAGTPVVACSLHSQMAVVAATVKALRPAARVVYVMTDGAALPLAISDLVEKLADGGVLAGTVTAGHAFGGDREAVTVPSALGLARSALDADVVVVAMGPGVVGTGTRLGTTALEVAPILDAAAWLGGTPVMCLRASATDQRPRHRGVSHHSLTALDAVRSPVIVPTVGGLLDGHPQVAERHDVRRVADPPGGADVLDRFGLRVTTMGRGPAEDPIFFSAATAAGSVAAALPPLPYHR